MPLSEFKPSWSVAVHEQPLFYSFTGTKRKISWNSQPQTLDNQQVERPVKRQCLTEHRNQTVSAPILNIVPQHSVTTQSSSSSMTSGQVETALYGYQQATGAELQLPALVASEMLTEEPSMFPLQHIFTSNNMVMDLCDETYSTTLPSDLDTGCMIMEANMDAQQPKNISYCSTSCGGGERSPSSNKIHCFCRPTWDTFADIGPYCSDYY